MTSSPSCRATSTVVVARHVVDEDDPVDDVVRDVGVRPLERLRRVVGRHDDHDGRAVVGTRDPGRGQGIAGQSECTLDVPAPTDDQPAAVPDDASRTSARSVPRRRRHRRLTRSVPHPAPASVVTRRRRAGDRVPAAARRQQVEGHLTADLEAAARPSCTASSLQLAADWRPVGLARRSWPSACAVVLATGARPSGSAGSRAAAFAARGVPRSPILLVDVSLALRRHLDDPVPAGCRTGRDRPPGRRYAVAGSRPHARSTRPPSRRCLVVAVAVVLVWSTIRIALARSPAAAAGRACLVLLGVLRPSRS